MKQYWVMLLIEIALAGAMTWVLSSILEINEESLPLLVLLFFIFLRVEGAIHCIDALKSDMKKLAGAGDTDKETTR